MTNKTKQKQHSNLSNNKEHLQQHLGLVQQVSQVTSIVVVPPDLLHSVIFLIVSVIKRSSDWRGNESKNHSHVQPTNVMQHSQKHIQLLTCTSKQHTLTNVVLEPIQHKKCKLAQSSTGKQEVLAPIQHTKCKLAQASSTHSRMWYLRQFNTQSAR